MTVLSGELKKEEFRESFNHAAHIVMQFPSKISSFETSQSFSNLDYIAYQNNSKILSSPVHSKLTTALNPYPEGCKVRAIFRNISLYFIISDYIGNIEVLT